MYVISPLFQQGLSLTHRPCRPDTLPWHPCPPTPPETLCSESKLLVAGHVIKIQAGTPQCLLIPLPSLLLHGSRAPLGRSWRYSRAGRSVPSRVPGPQQAPVFLSLQPLPLPVDHQQWRRRPRGARPGRACDLPRDISPGEPGCDFAPFCPGIHVSRRGSSGGAFADQHRRVHLDGRGLASLLRLGRPGCGGAPFSLFAGELEVPREGVSREPSMRRAFRNPSCGFQEARLRGEGTPPSELEGWVGYGR